VRATYTRIYADDQGVSHFEDLGIDLARGFAVPPAEPVHNAPFLVPDGPTFWVGALPDWEGGEPHPAPRRMIFVTTRGEYEVRQETGVSADFRLEVS
jgi:hypothetical protein